MTISSIRYRSCLPSVVVEALSPALQSSQVSTCAPEVDNSAANTDPAAPAPHDVVILLFFIRYVGQCR